MTKRDETSTGKIDLPLLLRAWRFAKGNPWVLAAVALGGGTGTQEILAQVGQNVQWWWVALAVAGYGALQYMADSAKRQEKIADRLAAIDARLARGEEKFQHLEAQVESLNGWRRQEIEARVVLAQNRKRRQSDGRMGSMQ